MSSISAITASSIISAAKSRSRKPKEKHYHLYECSYGCKHLWVSSKDSYTAKCPNCPNIHASVIANYVHPDLKFKRMQTVTLAQMRLYGYGNTSFENYPKDSLLTMLESQGFKPIRTSMTEVALENSLKESVLFQFSKSRKTSTVYIGLHRSDDTLFGVLEDCAKEDKKNKAAEPKPEPKPQISTMPDALGKNVTVGDWVCAWGTKSLSFGRIIAIEKFKECDWHTESEMIVGAKIKKGSTILPYKTSNQIFLLTPEQSLVLALEQ